MFYELEHWREGKHSNEVGYALPTTPFSLPAAEDDRKRRNWHPM